jgi:hypothetical protein
MIPHMFFGNPQCATPDPVYVFLGFCMTVCFTVVVYSAFLLFVAWLLGVTIACSSLHTAASAAITASKSSRLFNLPRRPLCPFPAYPNLPTFGRA